MPEADINQLIGQSVILKDQLDTYLLNSNLNTGDKASLSRKYNDYLRQLEKIRVQSTINN